MNVSEEMKRFEADMGSDKELREKFYKTVDRIAGEKTAQSNGELFAKAAQEFGYNITAADFEKLDAEQEEVSADELEQVAGGFDHDTEWCFKDYYCDYAWNRKQDDKGHDDSCVTAWHCLTVTLHSDTETDEVFCWSNHTCVVASKDPIG